MKEHLTKLNLMAFAGMAFVIPFQRGLVTIMVILFLLSSILNIDSAKNIIVKIKLFIPVYFIYLIYLVGLIYTDNISTGLSNIETKLTLLLFPIGFAFSKIDISEHHHKAFRAYIEGCFITVLLSIGYMGFLLIHTHNLDDVVYGNLSLFSHNSYFSMYLCLAMIFIYYYSFFPTKKLFLKSWLSIGLNTFFTFIIVLLASKSGLVTMLLVHLTAIIYWTYKYKKFKTAIITFLSVIMLIGGTYYASPKFKSRIDELFTSFDDHEIAKTSTKSRLIAWNTAFAIYKNHYLAGVGTGDVQDELNKKYLETHQLTLKKRNLNTHNQFLQTLLSIGIPGIISFILLLILPLYHALKNKQALFWGFLLLICINFAFESMLEKQEGVIFFAFFMTVLFYIHQIKARPVG